MRAAIARFGSPVYGLGEGRPSGSISGYDGGARCGWVSILFLLGQGDRLEVTTGRWPLGGTHHLVMQLILRTVPAKPRLPWQLSLSERNVFAAVEGIRTQFHVVEASSDDWIAAGGLRKRHLLMSGTPGVNVEEVALVAVTVKLRADAEDAVNPWELT